jgi:signal transduction histidine kinase
MAAVVVSFLVATAVSQYVESKSAKQLDQIVGNAMPSVQLLATVSNDLRRIDLDLASGNAAHMLDERRKNIDAAVTAYRGLPFFPGEAAMFAGVPDLLAQLDRQITAHQIDDARGTVDQIDHRLERLITYDATQGQRLGLSIARKRSESRGLVWLLDAASVVLAVGAMLLAIRQRRRALHVLEEEENEARQRLVELANKVDELGHFAGRVAHDIRGPLQTATMALEVVRAHGSEPAAQRGMKALVQMGALVDGLLEFARAGGKPAGGAVADVTAVVRDVVDSVAAAAKEKHIELRVEPVAGATVACSAGVLTSIVGNLVRNAIRHMGDSAERRIDVTVRDAGERWRIEVDDTGPGIAPGHEHRIFDPYVQLGANRSGLGLGLATVDRLVRAHGGVVGVLSPPGRGAMFWFELPRASEPA